MSREECKVIAVQDYCHINQKNEACRLYSACSVLNSSQNGDLTPVQLHEEFPKFKINQIVKIATHISEIDQQNKTPLRSFKDMLLKQDYIIPGTEICIFQGKDGRQSPCPNNPTNKIKTFKNICVTCSTYPDIAR